MRDEIRAGDRLPRGAKIEKKHCKRLTLMAG
ncbi:hypothetical protein J2803_001273 [Paraburkholderia phenoliruptrix]|nr:hypothetical protein [Paraburkholderia phenoliruptrix]